MLKVDLHTHTGDDPVDWIPHSSRELIDRAATLGFDALAITLHDRQLDVPALREYAAERGIVLVPGIERTIRGRHVLLLNFSRAAEGVGDFDVLARLKERERGLVIAPHPFFPARNCLRGVMDEYPHLFDGVEINGMFTRGIDFNRRAEQWAFEHDRPIVGNGDVHRLEQLGTTFSLVEAERDAESICEAVRAGRVQVVDRPHTLLTAARIMASLAVPALDPLVRPSQPAPAAT